MDKKLKSQGHRYQLLSGP